MTFLARVLQASHQARVEQVERYERTQNARLLALSHQIATDLKHAEDGARMLSELGAPNDARVCEAIRQARRELSATRRAVKGQR